MNRSLPTYVLLVLLGLSSVVRAHVDTAKYVCVQYVNDDFNQYHLNTCRLNGEPIAATMNGWKQTGNRWLQFDCKNCNNASSTAVALPVNTTHPVEPAAGGNDMFPCCYYSSPDNSWIQPMHGVGENPARTPTCPGMDLGQSLMGSWYMDSMYNCIAFGPYAVNSTKEQDA